MILAVIFKTKINCFFLDDELDSLETDGKRPKDLSQKKNKENGDTEQFEETYVFCD